MTDTTQSIGQGNEKVRLKLTISMYILFFTYAFSLTMAGPLIPVYIKQFGISLDQGGLISTFQGFGGIIGVFAGVFFSDRIKKSSIIRVSFIVYTLAVLVLSFTSLFTVLLVLFFIIGASTKTLDAAANANVADLNRHRRGFYLNLLHATFGLGAFAGPLLSTAFVKMNMPPNMAFKALGVLCIITFIQYIVIFRKTSDEAKRETVTDKTSIKVFLKSGKLLLLCMLPFLYLGISSSISNWMPTFLQHNLQSDPLFSTMPVTAFWLGVIAGRVAYSVIQEKIPTRKLLIICNVTGGAVFVVAVLLQIPGLIIGACMLTGLFTGAFNPIAVATASSLFPKNTGIVSSFIFFSASIGQMLFPWLLGMLTNVVDFSVSLSLIGVLTLVSAVFLGVIPAERKHQPQE